jgi:hypothetical protein
MRGVARAALDVTVVDASGKRVCDASVTARDGDFSAQLPAPPADVPRATCTYTGPFERAGTYSIEVRAGTTSKLVSGIKVSRKGACHELQTRDVTVVLDQ